MDYIDQLKQFSSRVKQLSPSIQTEEATKTALILPFFQMLGYDVFNPNEFVPEYTADVGIKKGERVDYAIVIDGEPVILVEAKWCGEPLDKHDSQLFRYFGTTDAKFAILTNGIIYRFYSDLDENNKMDLTPFMEFDMLNIKDSLVPELKRFQRASLDVESIFSAASELKYSNAIKELLATQFDKPDEEFTTFILSRVYTGRKTHQVVENFQGIVKRALAQFVNEMISDKIKNALEPKEQEKQTVAPESAKNEPEDDSTQTSINTTPEEIEAFIIVKSLLHNAVDPERLSYKDTKSYCNVILDKKVTRWVCRYMLEGGKKSIIIPNEKREEIRFYIDSPNDIYKFGNELLASLRAIMD